MRKLYLDKLHASGIISEEELQKIEEWKTARPFSLHWELRLILYFGILLFSTGLGIIIYQNIDTIGHTAIILLIASACSGCFYYCFRHKLPYDHGQVKHISPFFDYVLLLGCLLFLALEGYLQYQYNLFGTRYGLVTLIPAVLFLSLAYTFDHIGVLSLGITGLASFAGITASPSMIFLNQFSEAPLIFSGITLACLLIVAGYFFKKHDIKKHFTFTYYNFGFNILFLSLLAGAFTLSLPFIYFSILMLGCFLLSRYALQEQSFYFLLMAVIYAYIGITWAVFQLDLLELFGFYYFVISCIAVIYFFINHKKILKIK